MKILVVDDSVKHRKAAIEQLSELGHEVVTISDYTKAQRTAREQKFDVALLDLLMPAEATTLGNEGMKFFGQPFAVGFPLAVSMALQGVGLVAVATDTNHHNHPASAVMDWFPHKSFKVADSTVLFVHAPLKDDGVKDWERILRNLTA